MGDYFYWFSLGTALALIGLVILSVVFAPIAVATCVVIARVRGLPALQHGVAGGLCAASLFLPWAYLVLRMVDRLPPRPLVVIAYGILYSVWVYGPIIGGNFFLQGLPSFRSVPRFYDEPQSIFLPSIAHPIIILLVCASLMASAFWTGVTINDSQERQDSEQDSIVPQVAYVAPFGLAAFSPILVCLGLIDYKPVLEFLNLVD